MLTITRHPRKENRNSITVYDKDKNEIGRIFVTKHTGSNVRINFDGLDDYYFVRSEVDDSQKGGSEISSEPEDFSQYKESVKKARELHKLLNQN